MPFIITCPSCSTRMRARDEFAGRRLKCGKCGAAISFPVVAVATDIPVATVAAQPAIGGDTEAQQRTAEIRNQPERTSDWSPVLLCGLFGGGAIFLLLLFGMIAWFATRSPKNTAVVAERKAEFKEADLSKEDERIVEANAKRMIGIWEIRVRQGKWIDTQEPFVRVAFANDGKAIFGIHNSANRPEAHRGVFETDCILTGVGRMRLNNGKGIYKFEDNGNLTLCFSTRSGDSAPADFQVQNDNQVLFTLARTEMMEGSSLYLTKEEFKKKLDSLTANKHIDKGAFLEKELINSVGQPVRTATRDNKKTWYWQCKDGTFVVEWYANSGLCWIISLSDF